MPDELALTLSDNALDFIQSAAEEAAPGKPDRWKYSLLHLVDGIELLLKARLQEEHWAFLFQDLDQATLEKLESGDFRSVDMDAALKRLAELANLRLEPDDRRLLQEIRALRNRVRHFAVQVEIDQLRSLLAKGLNFAFQFSAANLSETFHGDARDRLQQELNGFQAFVVERLSRIASDLEGLGYVGRCTRCFQDALEFGPEGPKCWFCLQKPPAPEVIGWVGEGPIPGDCLRCGASELGLVLFNNDDGAAICAACGCHWQRICLACHALYFSSPPQSSREFCADCLPLALA